MGCFGINNIQVSGGCESNVILTEISLDGGVMYQNAGEGEWYYSSSFQPDGELKVKATIRKPGCPDQYLIESYTPDPECLFGAFTTIWNVNAEDEITIPIDSNFLYDYTIDWGDGSVDYNVTGDATHIYSTLGAFTPIKILGTFPQIKFSRLDISPTMKEKLVDITSWGKINWEAFNGSFAGCTGLTEITAVDVPDLSNVTTLASMFVDCTNLTSVNNINSWDISNITNLNSMFAYTLFNNDIGDWDTSNVTRTEYMFNFSSFNNGGSNSINNWNTSKIQFMGYMFYNNTSFNQPLFNWDVSSCSEFFYMFYNNTSFNQSLSNFDISSVTSGTPSYLNFALERMLDMSGMSPSNYDSFLIKLATTATTNNIQYVQLDAVGINYTSAGASSRNTLVNTLGWSITDAGQI